MDGDGAGRRGGRRRGGGDRRRRWVRPSPTAATWPPPRAHRRSSTRPSSGSGASTSWSTTPASSGGRASPTPTPTTSTGTSPSTSFGSFNTTRAAWPHMVEQGYGRIVMTTSSGMFGLPENLSYATAKARGHRAHPQPHASPGAAHGIKVNLIAPAAFTRMAGQPADEADPSEPAARRRWRRSSSRRWSPSWPTRTARSAARSTRPAPAGSPASSSPRPRGTSTRRPTPTIEDVAEHWATINDETGLLRPRRPHGLVGRLHGPPAASGPA